MESLLELRDLTDVRKTVLLNWGAHINLTALINLTDMKGTEAEAQGWRKSVELSQKYTKSSINENKYL